MQSKPKQKYEAFVSRLQEKSAQQLPHSRRQRRLSVGEVTEIFGPQQAVALEYGEHVHTVALQAIDEAIVAQ